jgi:hypothetical protein
MDLAYNIPWCLPGIGATDAVRLTSVILCHVVVDASAVAHVQAVKRADDTAWHLFGRPIS